MGFWGKLSDFIQFKEFVTPAFFKIIYLAVFIVLNLAGLAMIVMAVVMPFTAMRSNSFIWQLAAGLLMAALGLVVLLFYNLMLRMYFEIILLVFNIHGYLKNVSDNTPKIKK